MKISTSGGFILRDPISTAFSMIGEGGSAIQQYDSIANEWVPDRTIAPVRFTPHLEVSDPQNNFVTGTHNEMLADCRWTLDGNLLTSDKDFTIDPVAHSLLFMKNVEVGKSHELVFTAQVYDVRRGEAIPIRWAKVLSCQATTDANIKLRAVSENKILLNPLKDRGIVDIEVVLYNGDMQIPDNLAVFKWQVFGDNGQWRDISEEDFWYWDGANTRTLRVVQEYVQIIKVRVLASAKAFPTFVRSHTFQLRRFYGQYVAELLWIEGKYKLPDTSRAVAEVQVIKNNVGAVNNLEEYFDVETFYSRSQFQGYTHVSHTHRAEVTRAMFGDDDKAQHCFGYLVREKSAYRPITINGKVLTINGKSLCTQVPIAIREVD